MPFARDCLDTIGVCLNKVQTVSIGQACEGDVPFTLADASGLIDLTVYGIPEASGSSSSSSSSSSEVSPTTTENWAGEVLPNGEVKHGVELITKVMPQDKIWFSGMASVKDSADARQGLVTFHIDKMRTELTGVWLGMAIVWQHGVQRKLVPFYFEVQPNLTNINPGPLTVYEIRLAVRDVCPEMNFLLDTVEFSTEEIMWAIRRPIDYWNEIPPPLGHFTPLTFPFRYFWLEAVVGELLRTVAVWLRRNDLDYTAAGVTIDDRKKWPTYLQMAQERQAKWEKFVRDKKIEMNIEGGYRSLGGYYYFFRS